MALRRGVGCVVSLIVLACVASATGLAAVWYVVSREPSVRAELDARAAARHRPARSRRPTTSSGSSSAAGRRLAPHRRRRSLRKAKVDKRVGAVLIIPSGLQAPYWGKVQEVRDAILDFRRSGKPVVAYLEYADDREYYLASACNRVFLMPTAQLDLNGVASYELFLRGTLDMVGAYPDFLHVGDYKTAANQFTEKTFTRGAPRDGRVAQPRPVRAARARHRRRPQEDRRRGARAHRRRPVPPAGRAQGRARRRPRVSPISSTTCSSCPAAG